MAVKIRKGRPPRPVPSFSKSTVANPRVRRENLPVSKDKSHAAFSADQALSMFLGRDCEIAFFKYSPTISEIQQETGGNEHSRLGFKMQSSISEVARARLTPEAAMGMAMSMVEQLVEAGLVDNAALEAAFQHLLALPTDKSDVTSPEADNPELEDTNV